MEGTNTELNFFCHFPLIIHDILQVLIFFKNVARLFLYFPSLSLL